MDYTGKTKDALKIQNDAKTDEEMIEFLSSAFRAADAVMKPGAVFYIWYAGTKEHAFDKACQLTGWEVRQILIWAKNTMVMGRQDYQWRHEPCIYGWKGGADTSGRPTESRQRFWNLTALPRTKNILQ